MPKPASSVLLFIKNAIHTYGGLFFTEPPPEHRFLFRGGTVLCRKRSTFCNVKKVPELFPVAVDLPDAGAEAGSGSFFDEARHVLCRIAQKQSDLVGNPPSCLRRPTRPVDALAFVFRDISPWLSRIFLASLSVRSREEAGRAVEIDQGPVFGKPQGMIRVP